MKAKRILLVEDDQDIARNVHDLLESEGYKVDVACNGMSALEKLRNPESRPCLIILDLMMPIMDGFKFREEQEKDPDLAPIPVIIMTADGHIEAKKNKIGARAFIRKPVDIDILLNTVKDWVVSA